MYVHGVANIIKSGGKFIVLDYDWAGKDGIVRFPSDLNTKLPWPESVKPGGNITASADNEIVIYFCAIIQCKLCHYQFAVLFTLIHYRMYI